MHNGTAALAGCLNSRQSGHGAQQIQLWLLPVLQVLSPLRVSWRWGAEGCQRRPGGKPHCKGLLSALQRCARAPRGAELPCPYIINNSLLLALSKDSFCCAGDFLSCGLWMGDIKYGANILTLGEIMPGEMCTSPGSHPSDQGSPLTPAADVFCYQRMQLQTLPACTRAAGKGLGCSGESTITVFCFPPL